MPNASLLRGRAPYRLKGLKSSFYKSLEGIFAEEKKQINSVERRGNSKRFTVTKASEVTSRIRDEIHLFFSFYFVWQTFPRTLELFVTVGLS